MTSTVRNGAETAGTALSTFLTVPAGVDERIEVRATNTTGADITVDFTVQSPDSSVTKYVAKTLKVAAGDAVDIFPGGLKLGAGWKLQHRGSVTPGLDTAWSATPAV